MQEPDSRISRNRLLFAIAVLIGILSGVAAWAFRLLIGFIHNLAFLGQSSLNYDANLHTPESIWGVFVILVPVLGGLIVVWLIRNFAPEAKGHGVPEVMEAIYYGGGRIRGQVSIVKALASATTIGTGGSLGREGPIVQICSAFSSALGQWFQLAVNERNLLIACGASGGIAATFNAPLGGILFAIELLMLSVNSRTLLPVITSAVIAANVGRYLIGPDPAFHLPPEALAGHAESPLMLVIYFPFAALVGVFSLLFIKGIYWSEDWFEKLPVGPYLRHSIGMLALGILMYLLHLEAGNYYVQGVGYATIQDLAEQTLTSPWLLLVLLLAKFVAVLLTIGSGGSGGVFSPSLYLGATLGGLCGFTLAALFPDLGVDPVTMVLVGMAAMVAGTTSAPMTAAIMTYEMTLDYTVVLPIMVGVAVSYAVRHYLSEGDIYTIKLMRRGRPVREGLHVDGQSQVGIDEVVAEEVKFVHEDDLITGDDQTLCVIDENDVVIGIVNPMEYRRGVEFHAREAMHTDIIAVRSGLTLRQLFHEIGRQNRVMVLVSVDGSFDVDKVVGVLNPFNLTRAAAKAARGW